MQFTKYFIFQINSDVSKMKRRDRFGATLTSKSNASDAINKDEGSAKRSAKETKKMSLSNECNESLKIGQILKEPKMSRSKSYQVALRQTIYINFTDSDISSYSFWNQAYSNLEKRNSCYDDMQTVFFDDTLAKKKSIISL